MISSNDQVTGQCDFESSADGDTIHRCNDGFITHKAARDPAEANSFVKLRQLSPFRSCRSRRFEIVACGECPGPCSRHNRHPGLLVLFEVIESYT